MAAARALTYVAERRRRVPAWREIARRAYHLPGSGAPRIHHFVPGIVVAILAGAAAILTRSDGRELLFGWPFGVGAGLILDELALVIELDNPYWGSERLVAAQGAIATAGAIALGARFHHRGAEER
jgi:hypothetical protein